MFCLKCTYRSGLRNTCRVLILFFIILVIKDEASCKRLVCKGSWIKLKPQVNIHKLNLIMEKRLVLPTVWDVNTDVVLLC